MIHKVAGYFKIEATNAKTGAKRVLADWFPNLVTNGGLDRMATDHEYLLWCQVGSGSTEPANTNTSLVSKIGATKAYTSRISSVNGASPYYRSNIKVFRFSPGQATGNISEVGVGWLATDALFSRALVLDSYGNPTTITVLSDEYLDVTYEHRFYPHETDVTGSITFTGNIGGTYDYTLRPARIGVYVGQQGTSYGETPVSMNNCGAGTAYTDVLNRAYDGSLGIITSTPSGSYVDITSAMIRNNTYTAGTYTITQNVAIPVAAGNLAGGGIKSLLFAWGNLHYQIEFSSKIPKTNQDILSLIFSHTWARV